MKNQDNKYYGIYINNKKIPKPQDQTKNEDGYYNKYFESAKLKFEGRAFLIKDKDKEKDEMEEIKNNFKIKKRGKHLIKFINGKNEAYYINIRIIKGRFLLLLLLIPLLLGCLLVFKPKDETKTFELIESTKVSIDTNLANYVFDIGYGNSNTKTIDLAESVKDSKFIYPGTKGEFFITISTLTGNRDMFYQMQVIDEINKPSNLRFLANGKTYYSMTELAQNINGNIDKNSKQSLKIRWIWDYASERESQDVEDTENGLNPNTYKVQIHFVGIEKI